MAAIDRREASVADRAAALASARFVRLTVAPSADAIAAAAILIDAFETQDRPYHARIATEANREGREDEALVAVGTRIHPEADGGLPAGEATPAAASVVRALGLEPDPGWVAVGRLLGGRARDDDSPLARATGIGVPVEDIPDGLAHSTLVHGPYSGDPGAAAAFLGDIGGENGRAVASAVALSAVAGGPATDRTAETVSRFLRPFATPDGPFATDAGTADVIDTLAAADPGLGLAVACGQDTARRAAIDVWRDAAMTVHDRLRRAETARHPGFVVLRTDAAPAGPLARLLRDARSPEPTAAVITATRAAVASAELADATIAEAIEAEIESPVFHGNGRVTGRLAGDAGDLVASLREAIA